MIQANARIIDLPLEYSFGISRWSFDVQKTFIVSLTYNGQTGYGEATENKYYDVTVEKFMDAWEKVRPFVQNATPGNPLAFRKQLKEKTGDFRFLMAAIDEAMWDLYGKLQGKPTFHLLGLKPNPHMISTYTIGLDDIEVMKKKILENPWPVYKIKLGTDHDKEIIRALRSVTSSPFRVDANAAWTPGKTIEMSAFLKKMHVEFIEQPLPAHAYKEMREILPHVELPVLADESCKTEADLEDCLSSFHGINVKLTKAGGITPAYEMLKKAREAGKKTMIGCMTESSVGISAAAQLLSLCDYADLDGAILLKHDPADGVKITPKGVVYPPRNGNGVEWKDETL